MSVLCRRLPSQIAESLPLVFDSILQPTLSMIQSDQHAFPDHREAFFALLLEIVTHCHVALVQLPVDVLRVYIGAVAWAASHRHPQVQRFT
jgi:hypothetical protein